MYIFPCLGFGSILAKTSSVTGSMVEAASLGLADSLTADERIPDLLYPRLDRIREISASIAKDVIRAAQKDGVDRNETLREMSDAELLAWVETKMWNPAA